MTEALVRVERRLPPSARPARALVARAERLALGYEDRRRSRLRARMANGEEVALMLPRGTVLLDGDLLLAVDGRLIVVEAQAEAVLEVTHQDPGVLLRIAYHLGNRHIPVQLDLNRLLLAVDPVLADMARQLGGLVAETNCAFEPESGAYGGGHRHGHADTFLEDDALAKKSFAVHWTETGEGTAADSTTAGELHARHKANEHERHHQHSHAVLHEHDHGHDHPHDPIDDHSHDNSHDHSHPHDHDH
jgi:urease accessory protein